MLLCSNCSGMACNKLKYTLDGPGWFLIVWQERFRLSLGHCFFDVQHVHHWKACCPCWRNLTLTKEKKNKKSQSHQCTFFNPFQYLCIFTHFPTNCSFLSGPDCPDCPDCASSRSSLLLRSCKDFASKVITKRSKSLQFSCLERQQNLLQEQPSKIHQAHSH